MVGSIPARFNHLAVVLLIVVSLGAVFGPALYEHVEHSRSGRRLNDDARQYIWPLLRFREGAFKNDYLADYMLALIPVGFDGLYRGFAPLLDPRDLSLVLPYVLLAVMLCSLAIVSYRLGGPACAWGTLALCLSSTAYLYELAGGLPRAFGFPLAALAGCALISERRWVLAVCTCLGFAFYYPIGVLLAVVCVLDQAFQLASSEPQQPRFSVRRLAPLCAAGVVSVALVAPSVGAMRPFGPTLGPNDWNEYPEAAGGGRLEDNDLVVRQPPGAFISAASSWVKAAVTGSERPFAAVFQETGERHGDAILGLVGLGCAIGYGRFAFRDRAAARVLLVPAGAIVMYLISWLAIPHLYVPERYLKFALPLAVIVVVPVGAYRLFEWVLPRSRGGASLGSVSMCVVVMLLFGGRGGADVGLTVEIPQAREPLYRFLQDLPEDTVLAGWPETMDDIPIMSGRRVLLTREMHLPYHAAYVRELRARMNAVIDAYLAEDTAPLADLRDRYGVTHLLVERAHFDNEPPDYFLPFTPRIESRWARARNNSAVLAQGSTSSVFEVDGVFVLDLHRLQVAASIPGR